MTFMMLGNKDVVLFCSIRSDLQNSFLMLHVHNGAKHNILPNFRDRTCCCIVKG